MAEVRGCHFPDDLFYDVANLIWYAAVGEGNVRVGFTPPALVLSGTLLGFVPKRPGRDFEKARSFATVESGKWVGPARAAFDGVVVDFNEPMMDRPHLANRDPYGSGWMLVVRPSSPDWRTGLVTGEGIAPAFEAWMEAEKFPGCGAAGGA